MEKNELCKEKTNYLSNYKWGFTAEYDAVTFELLLNACDIYYISSNEFFSGVNKDNMNDRTGKLVQRTYKLHSNNNASNTII